jgi:hypothetical protein
LIYDMSTEWILFCGGYRGTALTSLFAALPPLAPSEGGGGSRQGPFRAGAGDSSGERHPTAAAMQGRIEAAVKQSAELAEKAVAAFQAFSRAYAAYPKPVKHIFHPKVLQRASWQLTRS